ncbi:hypothetical protein BDR03DRAFT_945839 [Suillus americanus]|nr:hypothetical protein BDR03DRAFT_945839 [Suillus americanus]
MVFLDDYIRAFVALHTFHRLCDDLYPSAQRLRDRRHPFFLILENFLYTACFVLSSAVALLHCLALREVHSHQAYVCFCTLTKATTGLTKQKEFLA